MKRELGLSAVILSIMLVRQLADGKISKRLQYSLWMIRLSKANEIIC